jgi:hypothetical protein
MFKSKPIADFPKPPSCLLDLVGFTACRERNPAQVFTLETVYHAFDMIAKQRESSRLKQWRLLQTLSRDSRVAKTTPKRWLNLAMSA